jgi:hypothetical protein
MYIYLQLKELVIFSEAPYDYITLLSLHSVPRDGWASRPAEHLAQVVALHKDFHHPASSFVIHLLHQAADRCAHVSERLDLHVPH